MVGRDPDLAAAVEQLERVDAGTPASVLVRGEAGVGKSLLVAAVLDHARSLGLEVVVARADEFDRGIPYALVRDLLARLGTTDEAVTEPIRRAIDGIHDRRTEQVNVVFAAVMALFRRDGGSRAAVAVLEDVHVADAESLVLAGLLMRLVDEPMLTVVTLRPGPRTTDLEQLAERLAGEGRAAVIDLEPLDVPETEALVGALLGTPPDRDLASAVHRASNGNPFFTVEATQALTDAGAVVVSGSRARLLPDAPAAGLRPSTALLRRIFVGAAGDVEVAKVMSVFGHFDLRYLPLAASLVGTSEAEVTAAFDRLVTSGLVAADKQGYGFTHPIVRDTLYEDIGPAERRRIHAAVAEALAREAKAGVTLDALELATHVAASASPGDREAGQTVLAAARAAARSAPLVAAEHAATAITLLPEDDPSRTGAMALRVRSLHLGARARDAASVGLEALPQMDDGAERDAVAGLVVSDLYLEGRLHEALTLTSEELERAPNLVALVGLRTMMLLQAGRPTEAAACFGAAVELALTGTGTPAARLIALAGLTQYANHVGAVDVSARLLEAVDTIASGTTGTARSAHEAVAFADWRPGLVRRIDQHLAEARALQPDAITVSIGGSLEGARIRVQCLRGEWDEALAEIRTASFDLEQRGIVPMAHMMLCAGIEILVDRGDLDAAVALADRLESRLVSNERNNALVRARIAHALGHHDAAEALLEGQRRDAHRQGASIWKLAEVLRELLDLDLEQHGRAQADCLRDELDDLAAHTGWVECELPALRARALVDHDVDAARHAVRRAEAEEWTVERAHALLVLGRLDDDPGSNLAEAYRVFDGIGAAPWRRRAAAELRSRSLSVPRRVTQRASSLTETETQLVRLVFDGLTNRQIAAAMHYSPKTIEVYLSRLYAKTGFGSRLELIRAVDTGELDVEDP